MATIQSVNNGDSGFAARTKINDNDANINAALEAAEALLQTDNASLDDFQKITDAIVAIQATLSVNDAAYDTLQEIVDKLKIAETKLATIETGAEVNVQPNWNETNNTNDAFIKNKPTLGTASSKNVGTAVGNIQENGANLGNSQTVETDGAGKFITATKNTAYNANFGTGNTNVARGDASYSKADTYTQTQINTALNAKENTVNKGLANGYASLDGNAQVPLAQLPANAKSSKVVADIATRDVIATADRFEGLRVHVLDATADTTVTSGGAGYILKSGLANTDWEKTYESESLDIDLSVYLNKTTDTLDDVNPGTTNKHFTSTLETKLNGIEDNATADQTDLEIKTAYENNPDTNAFTNAEKTKLTGIEQNATADQSDLEIKTAYENNVNTNAFTDAEKINLSNQSGTNTGDETTTSIQTKRPLKTIEGQSLEGIGDIDLTAVDVGLGNVDNTSDADKPISTAQQTALDGKLAKASNLSDVLNRQTSLNNLTDASNATNEYILTKDTATGNAVFKPAPGGAGGTNLSTTITGTTVAINSDTGNDATIPSATSSNAGVLTSADKTKLDGVEPNATADTTASIQTKRPLKTVQGQSLEGTGNIDLTSIKIQAVQNSLAVVTVNTTTPTTIATLNITPRNTANKILLLATGDGNPDQAGGFHFLQLYRDSNALDPYVIIENSGGISVNQPFALSSIDAPATTSAITYTVKAYQGSGSFTYGESGNAQATRLIALEFAPA